MVERRGGVADILAFLAPNALTAVDLTAESRVAEPTAGNEVEVSRWGGGALQQPTCIDEVAAPAEGGCRPFADPFAVERAAAAVAPLFGKLNRASWSSRRQAEGKRARPERWAGPLSAPRLTRSFLT
ncbi:hypothetical protein GGTG_09035 [Gaeumannomyces tritici R3-111a-1]|uniref:Uncharacterized protein n=1 Tax=Gaeumannomyces tritici (strain R3-111a-1) TaxID=644352 RepID=J3P694_GAET3|nr:hypothetical protein GGTG_09035 [Gaeumannomyces tritici R3-111a-1]EJT72168.1 hypothetical protein GGTG_09035 [Gaeumannomyces tritici R3-111a-1]